MRAMDSHVILSTTMDECNICTFLWISHTPLMSIMCPVEHFTQAALTGSISQIHSCGKNSAVTTSSGTSKDIRKTITAVSQARRPAKEGEGERGIEKEVEGNRERKGQQRGTRPSVFI